MKDSPRVLITGGGKRIGAALVRRFARLGFQVYIHVFRSAADAGKLRSELPESDSHRIVVCDFSDPSARRDFLAELPRFDVVINNASVYRLTPQGTLESAENRERYWQVNYHAPLEIIEHQKKKSSGCKCLAITLLDCDVLTGDGGVKPWIDASEGCDSYLPVRIALAHKLTALALEYAPDMRICSIAPGPVLPPVDCATPGMTSILDRVALRHPVGVEEIADTAEFFWRNPSLTGLIVPVDGGMHLN